MANLDNNEILKRLDDVIKQSWNHVTPGTPDHAYIEKFKRDLRAAISPTPTPIVAAVAEKTTIKKQD